MAIKRTAHVQIIRADGTTVTVDGETATSVWSAWTAWINNGSGYGPVPNGFVYENADGRPQADSFRCICSVILLDQTEEEVDGRPCEPVTCPPSPTCPIPPAE